MERPLHFTVVEEYHDEDQPKNELRIPGSTADICSHNFNIYRRWKCQGH